MREATSARALLQAMLDAEAALARAQAKLSLVPAEAARAIEGVCEAERFDLDQIGREAREAGNPVVPLVNAIRSELATEVADYIHLGATSQDILDSALSLVSRRAIDLIAVDLDELRASCVGLAEEHRETPMAARTLLQQAMPTTFGLKAAGWLLAAVDERRRLAAERERLSAQLGGAAGTLAWYGDSGIELLAAFAKELELSERALPWHTARAGVAELGTSLAITSGAIAKIALDVVLLSQSEVAEVAEGAEGAGGSSTLPQKRNPIASVMAIAAAQQVRAASDVLVGSLLQEHERAAGAWHAEWAPLRDALALTGGVVATVASVLRELKVEPERMRANLLANSDALVSEHLVAVLAGQIGREQAESVVRDALTQAAKGGGSLGDAVKADGRAADLTEQELEEALDPNSYLGSSAALIDRALEANREASDERPG